ncbi:Imidazole glycerol phosphate synthase amidotransferase subunit [hydrothermal vent metagenome]|uniref:Imidazole glycerol phosphate synthase amidotransferase subunit n=1 Tax=hydrothermal vent metagenome TaxID=652676 RepID=A0A3B1DE49_9ZZZZ
MITIVDYGMGNLRSVQKAFEKLHVDATICTQPEEIANAEKLVLPGVGAFRDAITELKSKKMVAPILEHIQAEKPFLGICLGLQLLFETSYEDGEWEGLGVLPGKVVRFAEQPDIKVPHMGWNQLDIAKDISLFKEIPHDAYFYFVHSFYVVPDEKNTDAENAIAAKTEHGTKFVSVVALNNLFATQFHPEKSQKYGLKLLENFAKL